MSSKIVKPNKNPLWQTNPKERQSYYLYFFGQNMIYNLVASFATTYLYLIGVRPEAAASVLLIVKVWDAVNDAIFGVIFDKIKFKSGKKYIPWLKIACALTPIATIAIFIIPNSAGDVVKLAWFAIAYLIWDTAYTICDVPAFGIITAMTTNIEERNTVLSLKGITGGIGSALTTVLASVLVSEALGLSYGVVSIIIAVAATFTMFPVCNHCEERVQGTDEENFTVRKMLKYVVSNKYLLIYYLGYVFYSGAQTYNSLHQLMAYYIYNNSLASLVTGTVAAVPQLIMALLVPKIIRRMDKMKLFRISTIATILLSIAVIPTRNSFILFVLMFMLRSIPLGIIGVLSFTFTPDCAEYGQYKTGTEAKGITFAIQTFAVKLSAALSGSIGLFLLGVFGLKTFENVSSFEDLAAMDAISLQTPEALDGLWFTYNIFPIFGIAIAFIFWNFFRLKDNQVQIMADCNAGKISKDEAARLLEETGYKS